MSSGTPSSVEVIAAKREGPVLLDSPHSGTLYPPDFRYACDLKSLRRAEDTHVDALFRNGPCMGSTLVRALFPRSYIDANRAADDIDPQLLGDGSSTHVPSEKSRLGMGLIWRSLDDGTPIYDRTLDRAEIERRIEGYWRPYHEAVARAHERIVAEHGHIVHVNCHSMPSKSALYPKDWCGHMPHDFIIGTRDGTSADAELGAYVVHELERRGYKVGVNEPFKGVELVRKFGRPSLRRHSIQLEINKRLYMDEETFEIHSGFARTQATIDALIAGLQTVHQCLR